MPIIRISHHKKDFLVMNKSPLRDDNRLSWKAKGILAFLLCLPNNWEINRKEIKNHSKDGIGTLDSGLRELKECGYCSIKKIQGSDGKFYGYEYEIFETPNLENQKNEPESDLPNSGKPNSVNPTLLNIDIIQYITRHKKEVLKLLGAKVKKTAVQGKFHPDSIGGKLAKHFLDCIEKHNPSFPAPDLASWEKTFNNMSFVMGLPYEEIKNILTYSQENDYWRLYMDNPYKIKFKYNILRGQMFDKQKKGNCGKTGKSVFDKAKEEEIY